MYGKPIFLSDDPTKLGRPKDFLKITISDAKIQREQAL